MCLNSIVDSKGTCFNSPPICLHFVNLNTRRNIMWTKPTFEEMRFGFEVTMYVMNK